MGLAADSSEAQSTPAGLFRRLGAILSDSLVLFGILALTTLFLFVPVLTALGKKAMVPSEVGWLLSIIYGFSLLGICFGFYGYFWTRSGQTIGMRAWRLKLISAEGGLLNWRHAFLRWLIAVMPCVCCLFLLDMAESLGSFLLELSALVVGALGVLDFLSMYGHTDRLCWHDKMSSSKIILLPER
jgi:uncharacterized RDD family membrane protein YckC